MGEMPDWYLIIRVARYLGVPPWEMLNQSEQWLFWGLDAMNAEALAEQQRNK
jgi:hypothetical protein